MIRWGIIAPGAIANAFAKEINNTGNGILTAVYGRNEERAKNFAEKYAVKKYYSNIDEFLKDDEIDAVYIATPHNYHVEYAEKCIKARKHILCEKPLSYNYASAESVLKLAEENNVFCMEALWTLFLPAVKKAKNWIEEGRIGKVKLITANFGFKSVEDLDSRLYNPHLAGGALLDVGIYTILIANFITGSIPTEIKASAVMTKSNVDETDIINLKYEDDILASLSCSISSETENNAVIYGENGKIVIPMFWMAKEALLFADGREERFADQYDGTGYKHEIIEANECIKENETESKTASHKVTLELASIMDQIRKQINLQYPFE